MTEPRPAPDGTAAGPPGDRTSLRSRAPGGSAGSWTRLTTASPALRPAPGAGGAGAAENGPWGRCGLPDPLGPSTGPPPTPVPWPAMPGRRPAETCHTRPGRAAMPRTARHGGGAGQGFSRVHRRRPWNRGGESPGTLGRNGTGGNPRPARSQRGRPPEAAGRGSRARRNAARAAGGGGMAAGCRARIPGRPAGPGAGTAGRQPGTGGKCAAGDAHRRSGSRLGLGGTARGPGKVPAGALKAGPGGAGLRRGRGRKAVRYNTARGIIRGRLK
jgi:hypothetical protein